MNTIDPKELTSKQRRAWDETRTATLYEAPMFSHLLYSMMSGPHGDVAVLSTDIATAACDDRNVIVNPETFLERPLGERVFMLTHEISRAMFGYAKQNEQIKRADGVRFNDGSKVGYNEQLLKQAQEFFVNALLTESNIGTKPFDAPLDSRFSTKNSVMDIYRTIYEEQEKDDKGNGGDDGQGSGEGGSPPPSFNENVPPGAGDGQSSQQAMDDRDDDRWASEVKAGMDNAKARGKLPGAMEEALNTVQEVQTNWKDHMRSLLDKAVGTGAYDWRTPDRRMIARLKDPIFAPGRRGFKCGTLVVIGDSSGSIGKRTVDEFMSQVAGMLEEMEPEAILFTWCDARTHGWQELSDLADLEALAAKGAKGRGGTDFRPPFKEIEDMGITPDAMVFLTDGYGPFPKEAPSYQVIWGDISGGAVDYPFGTVVSVPVQAE